MWLQLLALGPCVRINSNPTNTVTDSPDPWWVFLRGEALPVKTRTLTLVLGHHRSPAQALEHPLQHYRILGSVTHLSGVNGEDCGPVSQQLLDFLR